LAREHHVHNLIFMRLKSEKCYAKIILEQ
jgi:hypothetical protein